MLIICIVGLSGTGKSTVATCLEQRINSAVNNPTTLIHGLSNIATIIKSYTTRAQRDSKDDGHTYVSDEQWKYDYEYARNDIVSFTKYGHHYYWAMRHQFSKQLVSIFVVDPKGVQDIKDANMKHGVFTTILTLPDSIVQDRLVEEYRKTYPINEAYEMAVNRMARNKDSYADFKADFTIENEGSFNTAQILLKEAISYYPMTSLKSVNEVGILRWASQ